MSEQDLLADCLKDVTKERDDLVVALEQKDELFAKHTIAVAEFLNELGPYLGLEDGKAKPDDWIKAASDIRQWCADAMDKRSELTTALEQKSVCIDKLDLDYAKASSRIEQLEASLKQKDEMIKSMESVMAKLGRYFDVEPGDVEGLFIAIESSTAGDSSLLTGDTGDA